MVAGCHRHPEALAEYADVTKYYLRKAGARVACRFACAIELAVASVVATPTRWQVVEEPDIRPYIVRGFPFVIYYCEELKADRVVIYAVMHCSREPGYWHDRLSPANPPFRAGCRRVKWAA